MSLADEITRVLGSGNFNDKLKQHYITHGATGGSLMDCERQFLAQVVTESQFKSTQDMWVEALQNLGLTGSFMDMLVQFWTTYDGAFGIPATRTREFTLDNDAIANNASDGNLLLGIDLGTGVTHVINTNTTNGVFSVTDDDDNPTWSYDHDGTYAITDTAVVTFTGSLGSTEITIDFTINPAIVVKNVTVANSGTANNNSDGDLIVNGSVGGNITFFWPTIPMYDAQRVTLNPTNTELIVWQYVHDGSAPQEDYWVIEITGDEGKVIVQMNITISATGNISPTAVDDSFTFSEDDGQSVLNVLANDTDPDAGDTLAVIDIDTTGTIGLATLADGTVYYNPNGQFESLPVGATAIDSFDYTVSDGAGGTDTATVNITINGVNDAPVSALPITMNVTRGFSANEDDLVGYTSLLDGVVDVDAGDTFAVDTTPAVAPTHGSVTLVSDGTFTLDNNGNAATTDTFTVTIRDLGGSGLSINRVVNVNVNDVASSGDPAANIVQHRFFSKGAVVSTHLGGTADSSGPGDLGVLDAAPTAGNMLILVIATAASSPGATSTVTGVSGFVSRGIVNSNGEVYQVYTKDSCLATDAQAGSEVDFAMTDSAILAGLLIELQGGASFDSIAINSDNVNTAVSAQPSPSVDPGISQGYNLNIFFAESTTKWNDPPDQGFTSLDTGVMHIEADDNTLAPGNMPYIAVTSIGFDSAPGALQNTLTTTDPNAPTTAVSMTLVIDGTPAYIEAGGGGDETGTYTPTPGTISGFQVTPASVPADETALLALQRSGTSFLITDANRATIQTRFDSGDLAGDKAGFLASPHPINHALRWQIYADNASQKDAAIALLNGMSEGDTIQGTTGLSYFSYHQGHVAELLAPIAWLWEEMSTGEQQHAESLLHARMNTSEYMYRQSQVAYDAGPPGQYPYRGGGDKYIQYGSNVQGLYDAGPFELWVALFLLGRGHHASKWWVDHLLSAYVRHDFRYSPFYGGYLSLMSLMDDGTGDTGTRAGQDGLMWDGYSGTLLKGYIHTTAVWESAMIDDLRSQTSWFNNMGDAAYIEYEGIGGYSNQALQGFEVMSGFAPNAVARQTYKHLMDLNGRSNFDDPFRWILSDHTVVGAAPSVDKSGYIGGMTLYSREGFTSSDNAWFMYGQKYNFQRNDHSPGAFSAYNGSAGKWALARGIKGKAGHHEAYNSAMHLINFKDTLTAKAVQDTSDELVSPNRGYINLMHLNYGENEADTYNLDTMQQAIATIQKSNVTSESYGLSTSDEIDVTLTYDNVVLAGVSSITRRLQKADGSNVATLTDTITGKSSGDRVMLGFRPTELPDGVASNVITGLGFNVTDYAFDTNYVPGDIVRVSRNYNDHPVFLECSVAGKTPTLASVEPPDWAATTAYSVDDIVKISSDPNDTQYLICVTDGTSGSTVPTFVSGQFQSAQWPDGNVGWEPYTLPPTSAGTDGGVTWIMYAGTTDYTMTITGLLSIRVQSSGAFVPMWYPEMRHPDGLWHDSYKDGFVPGYSVDTWRTQLMGMGLFACTPVLDDESNYDFTSTVTLL